MYNETTVPGGELVLVTEKYYSQALRFLDEHYTEHEPINKAMGIHWNQEQEQFFLDNLKLNMSLMLLEPASGEVMAIR